MDNSINNASGRFRTIAAVLILLTRKIGAETEYLLQKRQNTGFADGMWDFSASGHVEKDEPMTTTVRREVKEEINIDVLPKDIEFMGLLHSFGDGEPRFLGCFKINNYSGKLKSNDPEKVSELKWFNENNLPDNLIDSRKKALERFKNDGVFYQEFGWD